MIDDEILDVSDALDDWLRPRTVKTISTTTVNFEPVEMVSPRTQMCMVQPAQAEELVKRDLDVKLRHIMVHSKEDINMGELVELDGLDFRVIGPAEWKGYGYVVVMAAETKEPLR